MFTRLPPMMERTLRDDVRWALCVLAGALIGFLVFGGDDGWAIAGVAIGAVTVIVVLQLARRVQRRGGR